MIKIEVKDLEGNEIKNIEASHGDNLLEVLKKNQIPMNSSCGGNATCGTCKVEIGVGIEYLTELTDLEKEFATDRCYNEKERLSCQSEIQFASTTKLVRLVVSIKNED